ncbi:cytochrome b561 [Thiosulfatimonas sediminis]|uniref:Cytochrome b561 n=1 Tax=Thiosulfatimonas sediminis TaxID=2675054 RepID=A0A6F8PX54_9GAMM|nr:cytochrome b [Thiosulfatimonas sediminis]BBP46584.1 cytochrome b561 [Thiosulfatimonas sediminis]
MMNWKNNTQHYGWLSISLHWLMALLILAAFASIEMRGLFEKGSETRDLIKHIHFMLGLSILALVLIRLSLRLFQTQPVTLSAEPSQQKLSKIMHWTLYVFMLFMPILGWLTISAEGKQLLIFGTQLPQLVMENHDLAEFFEESHEILGQFGYLLIGLHALAGILHHYLWHDATLMRMLGRNGQTNSANSL